MRFKNWLKLFTFLAVAFAIHGYWYSTSVINKYVGRCGAYPALDEAIQANRRHNNFEPQWFEHYIKAQNSDGVPYTWYVVYRVKPEYQAALEQAPKPPEWCGGSFYYHTRYGWVGMPEHFLNAFGYLDIWMRAYYLYGGEL
jgi:hypothetical protein